MLVSDESVVAEDEAISVSVSHADPPSDPSVSKSGSSSSRNLGAAFLPGDGSSGVQTLSQPTFAPPRTNRLVFVGAGIGVVAAGAAFLLFGSRAPDPAVHESAPSAEQAAKTGSNPAPKADDNAHEHPVGVNIENLPPDPAAAAAAAAKARDPSAPPPSAATPEQLARDIAAMRVEQKAPEPRPVDPKAAEPKATDPKPEGTAKVTLTEEQERDRVAAIAKGVSLDGEENTPSEPAPATSSDFDKAAAQTAMSRAMNMVGMCRRPGGDAGPGRVVVILANTGKPQSVVVQGKLSGTPVGECIAGQFRNVKVPTFTGAPMTLSKSFIIPAE
jgi:hypothetical protein